TRRIQSICPHMVTCNRRTVLSALSDSLFSVAARPGEASVLEVSRQYLGDRILGRVSRLRGHRNHVQARKRLLPSPQPFLGAGVWCLPLSTPERWVRDVFKGSCVQRCAVA